MQQLHQGAMRRNQLNKKHEILLLLYAVLLVGCAGGYIPVNRPANFLTIPVGTTPPYGDKALIGVAPVTGSSNIIVHGANTSYRSLEVLGPSQLLAFFADGTNELWTIASLDGEEDVLTDSKGHVIWRAPIPSRPSEN